MFLIPTVVAPSPIHGMGVFAAVDIPAMTVIWDIHPDVDWEIPPDDLARFPDPWRAMLKRYCYLNDRGVYIFCGDNGKFMNHAAQPNCHETGVQTITSRDIAAGEELTCDYRTFDHEPLDHPID